ncbi:hypothetical protein L1I79_33750 [Strepomyces sp. STD 3.1]|nr:hypothetical protein [Streptomyces sp. STD 3.1]
MPPPDHVGPRRPRRAPGQPRTDDSAPRASAARTEVRTEPAASARGVLADVQAALRSLVEGRYGHRHRAGGPSAARI